MTNPAGENKVYGAILAGGSGTRMGSPEKPKQFLTLGEKPVLIHTLEKFAASGLFDGLLVVCPMGWIDQTRDLIQRYDGNLPDVLVAAGGATRNDSILSAIACAEENFSVDEATILVTHDAVRPFVSHRILEENIQAAVAHGACDTVIPATDTIVESADGQTISAIPDRSHLYQGQTPQSFRLRELKAVLESLSTDEKEILTDACKAYVLRDKLVALVAGDSANMKITYPEDMRLARALMGEANA